jgi:hypothetical protein
MLRRASAATVELLWSYPDFVDTLLCGGCC